MHVGHVDYAAITQSLDRTASRTGLTLPIRRLTNAGADPNAWPSYGPSERCHRPAGGPIQAATATWRGSQSAPTSGCALEHPGEAHDRQRAEQCGQAELEGAVGEHRGGGCAERRAVEHERRDQAPVGAADAARQGNEAAELADDVGESEDADRREGADRGERRAEREKVEDHEADRAGEDQRVAGAHEPDGVADPGAERGEHAS